MASNFTEFNRRVWRFTEDWRVVRLVGEMSSVFEFWIPILTNRGRRVSIPKICLCWDSEKHRRAGTCPYCQAGLEGRPVHFTNAIIRSLQNGRLAFSETASPVRVLKIPPRFHRLLENLRALNGRTNKSGKRKHFDLAHPRFGVDVQIKFKSGEPCGYYDAGLFERTKLTAEELAYPLSSLEVKPETLTEARFSWQKLKTQYAGQQPLKTEDPLLNWTGWGLR